MKHRFISVAAVAFILSVCAPGDGGAAEGAAADSTAPAAVAVPQSGGGATISGRVRFTGAKPTMRRIDMSDEASCASKYPTPPTAETAMVGANGALANVFIYVKAGLPAGYTAPAATGSVVIDQSGCRYHPHVLGIRVGQTLEIKNSDGLLHNIKAKGTKNRPFNISQPRNMTTTRTFTAPEVMVSLECSVHGWMQAYAGVVAHNFFAVTGADGSFRLQGLPPGTYTIEAWHEQYGTKTATVTVAGAESKTSDITFAAQ